MIKSIVKSVLPRPVWSFLRSQKLKHLIQSYEPRVREGNYSGHNLKVLISDPLAEGWYDHDWPVIKEIELLKKSRLVPGAQVFDLGAHQSVVAMVLAREVGENGKVLAVEANSHNAKVSCENRDLNGLSHIEVLSGAVGEEPGVIEFSEDFNGAIGNKGTQSILRKVTAFTVDELSEKYFHPDVIFMDIEGFEARALNGAKKMLNSQSTDWFIEVHNKEYIKRFGGTPEDVLNFFDDQQFDLFVANEDLPFEKLSGENEVLNDRFFLVAINKGKVN